VVNNFFTSAWLAMALVAAALSMADVDDPASDASARAATSLAEEVEELVAHSKPAGWEMRRSCLYYALAGQYLLARNGIDAILWTGAVVYHPETRARHPISPHAWLETASHFIDYSTLPRWGEVTVIPREQTATEKTGVHAGITRVLLFHRPGDSALIEYLDTHRARFGRIVNGED
jgi:hypothetical protein